MSGVPSTGALLELACESAREAGRQVLERLPLGRWRGAIEHKSARDLVTEVDRASERLIVAAIRQRFPDHAICGEEGGAEQGAGADAPVRWVIDPLDGTTNFLHSHPFFAVSIAAERVRGGEGGAPEMLAGVIYAPYLDELYFAERGGGAYLSRPAGGAPASLSVSDASVLDEALVATGFSYDRARYPNEARFVRMLGDSLGVRRCGAAALDLAFVAAGRYDAFWELGLASHDVAAGSLLVQEAGGTVTDLAGGDDWLKNRGIIATNGRLQEAVRQRVGV